MTYRPPGMVDRFGSARHVAVERNGYPRPLSLRGHRPLSLEAILERAFSPERE
jgi:hypothetical protein